MKLPIAIALLALSLNAFAQRVGTYELLSVPSVEIDRYVPIGSDQTNTPKNLQGLFWMDGNPLADKIVTFANLTFTDIKNLKGEVIGHKVVLPVYDEGVWTWDDTEKGHELYQIVHDVQLTYVGIYNADYTFGQITPVVKTKHQPLPVPVLPSLAVDFTMTLVNPDEFSRDSILLAKHYQYRFRRVVDGNGHHLPAWDDYVAHIETKGPKNGLVPVCALEEQGTQFPTACARMLVETGK